VSFECPHIDAASGNCLKLKGLCVPGRRGCELAGRVVFASPSGAGGAESGAGRPSESIESDFHRPGYRCQDLSDQGERK